MLHQNTEVVDESQLTMGEDVEVIYERIKKHVPEWSRVLTSIDQVAIRRLSGLSNACYRVALRQEVILEDCNAPRDLCYRKFTC